MDNSSSSLRLAGKSVLITGAAQGLGAAQAIACAGEGARVTLTDITDREGAKVEAEIRAKGGECTYLHLDVSSESEWMAVVGSTVARYGVISVLVNNAGIVLPRVPIEERSVSDWDRLMSINIGGVFLGIKHVIPIMRRQGGGSIVNISSLAGIGQSQIQELAYATSKGAVRILSKVIAAQHAHENIRCNSLHPGPINGGMFHRFMPSPDKVAERLKRVPMGRMGEVKEIVAGMLFLASDESSYMTGAELVIDGGALAQ